MDNRKATCLLKERAQEKRRIEFEAVCSELSAKYEKEEELSEEDRVRLARAVYAALPPSSPVASFVEWTLVVVATMLGLAGMGAFVVLFLTAMAEIVGWLIPGVSVGAIVALVLLWFYIVSAVEEGTKNAIKSTQK